MQNLQQYPPTMKATVMEHLNIEHAYSIHAGKLLNVVFRLIEVKCVYN